ncbi:hypothetical protein NC652_029642 [Populus alba x Populus x berolinensis]|nr:hypothetical protein NC652_029642 [Populus alba x Populus x berolinensis]
MKFEVTSRILQMDMGEEITRRRRTQKYIEGSTVYGHTTYCLSGITQRESEVDPNSNYHIMLI